MSDLPTSDATRDRHAAGAPHGGGLPQADGGSVGVRVALGSVIAVVVLGFGAWWTWGLDRGMPMDGMDQAAMDGMEGMPTTDVRLPPVPGLYAGEQIFFSHPEASDAEVAATLTGMMAGSPVLVVPDLAEVPEHARDEVYVFANGVEGVGPFGFQRDVFPTAPGDEAYSPLRTVVLVTWRDEGQARELTTAEAVSAAVDAGEVDLEETPVVVNMPFLTWPGGQR